MSMNFVRKARGLARGLSSTASSAKAAAGETVGKELTGSRLDPKLAIDASKLGELPELRNERTGSLGVRLGGVGLPWRRPARNRRGSRLYGLQEPL